MPLSFHWVPARDSQGAEESLNRALRSLRVVAIEKHFCSVGPDPGWAVCLEYLDGGASPAGAKPGDSRRVDYREQLDPETFKLFAALRDWRKEAAARDGVPVYAVLSNEQLALVARRRCASLADLQRVEGVGQSPAGEEYAGC